jgi:uncharacterized membrane protein YeaQ/YmgE (transglycosylase-associated protein family)
VDTLDLAGSSVRGVLALSARWWVGSSSPDSLGWETPDVFDVGGVIEAIIGSIVVLVAVGWFLRRTGRRPAS